MPDTLYSMIDVSPKTTTFRKALALGRIQLGEKAFAMVKENTLPKGDARVLAEVAGINGAKGASQTIPLCHPLTLDHITCSTHLEEDTHSVAVLCVVSACAKTGVEMEALAGVNAALLAIYDLCKMIEPALNIDNIRLLFKQGGKKGLWQHPTPVPAWLDLNDYIDMSNTTFSGLNIATLTASTRAANGVYDDASGNNLKSLMEDWGANVVEQKICEDDNKKLTEVAKELITKHAPHLLITTGGTGLSPTDVTPEALGNLCYRQVPGIAELLRSSGAIHTPMSWLSRSFCGVSDRTLVIALPGNPNAISEGLSILKNIIPHAIALIRGDNTHV